MFLLLNIFSQKSKKKIKITIALTEYFFQQPDSQSYLPLVSPPPDPSSLTSQDLLQLEGQCFSSVYTLYGGTRRVALSYVGAPCFELRVLRE